MDILFILFIGAIIFGPKLKKAMDNAARQKGTDSRFEYIRSAVETATEQAQRNSQDDTYAKGHSEDEHDEYKASVKRARRKEARRKNMVSNRRDANDRNRHRRSDWGERDRGGLLTGKNLLVLTGMIVIALYLATALNFGA